MLPRSETRILSSSDLRAKPHRPQALLTSSYCNDRFSHGFTWDFFTSLDQSIWFHDYNFRADDWLLLETWTPVASESFFGHLTVHSNKF